MINVLQLMLEDLLRPISGNLGIYLRRWYYTRRFAKCGFGLNIAPGVRIYNPHLIELGNHIVIDINSVLIAGMLNKEGRVSYINRTSDKDLVGRILIGSYCHIGINNIFQGHGGIRIGDYFSSSANCTIFSFSSHPGKCKKGTIDFLGKDSEVYYVSGPVLVGQNVWIGLNVNLISCTLGDDVFVKSGITVSGRFSDNNIIGESSVTIQSLGKRFK
jgi:acetyltransferase-like isoleucine patch superfamily enzyme